MSLRIYLTRHLLHCFLVCQMGLGSVLYLPHEQSFNYYRSSKVLLLCQRSRNGTWWEKPSIRGWRSFLEKGGKDRGKESVTVVRSIGNDRPFSFPRTSYRGIKHLPSLCIDLKQAGALKDRHATSSPFPCSTPTCWNDVSFRPEYLLFFKESL